MDSTGLLNMSLELNVARKCRTCGMDIHDLTCAFPIFGNEQLDTKIQRYLQLNIQRDDLLPKCVCGSCYLKLESIDQFAVMANRTDDAFRAWISRLRGLNSPDEAVKSVNIALPLFRTPHQPPLYPPPSVVDERGNIVLLPQSANVIRPQPGPQGMPMPGSTLASPSVVCYSDLKLGLLIKDQELLKLILKALKWAENDRRATFDVLIQRLKNSSFREVLSNRNLLNDSDLTQLLKSYIGQGVMNSLLPAPGATGSGYILNNNVPPPLIPLQPTIGQQPSVSETVAGLKRIKLPPVNPNPPGAVPIAGGGAAVADLQIDEASVTQMEVGVDPNLYFPYDDEDSGSTTKFESNARLEDRQENTVTIKLMSTNGAGDLVENKRMIPAILNVRGSNRFQCSACPECFPTNGDLQQHIVSSHLSKGNRPVLSEKGKPAIKIRVRKNRPLHTVVPKPSTVPPLAVTMLSSKDISSHPVPIPAPSPSSPPGSTISIAPLKIPASTTITMIPMSKKVDPPASSTKNTDTATTSFTPPTRKPIKEPLIPKVELVRKSKRKPLVKTELSASEPEKKRVQMKDQAESPPEPPSPPTPIASKSTRRTTTSFCALCRKRLAPRENIREHMEQEHSRYECGKCDRVYKRAGYLARHQQSHSAGPVVAAETEKSEPQKPTKPPQPVDIHPNKCTFCGRNFKRSNHLKLHLNHHLKDAGRSLVETTPQGNGLRTRTSQNRAIDGNSNAVDSKAKKPLSKLRKNIMNRKSFVSFRK